MTCVLTPLPDSRHTCVLAGYAQRPPSHAQNVAEAVEATWRLGDKATEPPTSRPLWQVGSGHRVGLEVSPPGPGLQVSPEAELSCTTWVPDPWETRPGVSRLACPASP